MSSLKLSHSWWVLLAAVVLFTACQGSNPSISNPRPRSREAAGEQESLPFEADLSNRESIDSDGGSVEYRNCRLTVPRGAIPEPLFVEIGIPETQPETVLPETAYQINPDGFELGRDALLEIGYFDEDVPVGKDESDLVIVHSVSGVWVELSNSQVKVHANTVEAPVRYLGLYALRIASEDPRRVNTRPVAKFEFSEEPYDETLGPTLEEAREQTEPAPAEEEGDVAPGEEPAPPEEELPPEEQERRQRELEQEQEQGNGEPPPEQGLVLERRMVAGPEDREAEQAAAGGNVAEAESPVQTAGDAEAPVTSEEPRVTVYFNASASFDPDGKIVQYDWDFDSDGVFDYSSHSGPYAQHDFKINGDYTVTLKVSDNGRYPQAGYGTSVVRVRNPLARPAELSAQISAYPADGPSPHTVHLAATTIGGTPPYSYNWTFSDGSESSLANPYTTYPEPGGHTIKFEVTDIKGEALTGSVYVRSLAAEAPRTPQPRMELSVSPTTDRGQAPFTGKFQLLAERATQPVTYRISFGDGSEEEELVTTEDSFSHVFTNSGFYLVKVIATDADLRTASTFATVHAISPASARDFTLSEIEAGGDPFSFGHDMFIAVDYTEASGRTVKFSAHDTPRDAADLAYQWDFGDGTFSTEQFPEHTFARDGIYEVRVTADDGLERWRHRIWLPVSAEEPAVAIQRPPYSEGPAPLGITFEAIVTRGEEPLRYDWNFDPARRSDPGTYYEFQMPGDYEVNLTVYDRYDQPIVAQPVEVKVRPGPVTYRQPLAVVQPVAGSTRAVVLDYTAANPLPLSNPNVEGPVDLVGISSNGQYAGMVGEEGLLVKEVASADPVLSFLPAAGIISRLHVLDSGAAYATVETSAGRRTYLLRNRERPEFIANGTLAAASGDGGVLVLRVREADGATEHTLFTADPEAPQFSEPQPLGKLYDVALPRDGRELFFIDTKSRLVLRTLSTGEDEYLSGGGDLKSGLTVSAAGNAVAFVSQLSGKLDVIYGRWGVDGVFGLASLTEQTGFVSDQLRLSADGDYLLAYGSRTELALLMGQDVVPVAADAEGAEDEVPVAEGESVVAEPGVVTGLDAEDVSADDELMPQPPRRRERFGIIRFNLTGSPDDWNLSTTSPRFVVECTANFSSAGPFR